jgi:DNA modification methylase
MHYDNERERERESISINLMLGDCLERMKEIESGSIDLILADPPYGTTACKWDSIIPLEPMWEQLKRVIKPNGAIVMTASQPFTTTLIASNMKMFKYCWVWEKTKASGHLDAKRKPMRKHEDIAVFSGKGWPSYYPQGLVSGEFKTGRNADLTGKVYLAYGNHGTSKKGNYPKTVIKFANPSGKGHKHPTQKPVPLMEYLIKTYTNEGETVLDFTMGSGTTGVACVNTNRNFIGIEKDEAYFKIAQDRINNALIDNKIGI